MLANIPIDDDLSEFKEAQEIGTNSAVLQTIKASEDWSDQKLKLKSKLATEIYQLEERIENVKRSAGHSKIAMLKTLREMLITRKRLLNLLVG
ncbi:hypothetical protein [Zooshikella harenae]|uniref:Uncharacterized protein n=1 Tax=Zooshikella harenae TaxID=2827238 RepID=A0ABS5ZE56_9GAMM|nr:hypothetical protein [Zooshikella harenae]MBU2712274.1 hypothetical protein [Zooshikella harenae]